MKNVARVPEEARLEVQGKKTREETKYPPVVAVNIGKLKREIANRIGKVSASTL